MIEAALYTAAGAKAKAPFALPAELFDGTVNGPVLHTVIRAHRNNQRQGTAATKSRSEVSGGNQKPWRQKGTGRARQGTTRAPHWRGGGVAFGPQPRSYRTDVPKKVKALARKSALNARAGEGALHVVEQLALEAPKTSAMAALLDRMGLAGRKVLVLTNGLNRTAWLSGRNLPRVQVLPWAEASAYDVLWSDAVVVEQGALTGEPAEAAAPTAARPARRAPVVTKRTTKKATAKKATAKKATAKKAAAKKATARKATAKAAKPAARAKAPRRPATGEEQ